MQNFKLSDKTLTCICLVLAALTCFVYWDSMHAGYIQLDDQLYVAHNEMVLSGLNWQSVKWAFSAVAAHETANWHPLTWISLMADAHLSGAVPEAFHRTNVLLHSLNSVLVFLLFARMTGSNVRSAAVAVVFAVHPIHVESVAWISERKDVLSMCFGLLALHAYVTYAGCLSGRSRWYAACLLATVASLLCKQMLVTLPVLLLLIDYWPLRRTTVYSDSADLFSRLQHRFERLPDSIFGLRTWLVIEKIPFAFVSAAFCVVALCSQSAGKAVSSIDAIHLLPRVGNALIAYGKYLRKSVFPTDLAIFYPYPVHGIAIADVIISLSIISAISVLVVRYRQSCPFLMVGWLWFIVSLLPVIGIVQIGSQQMADRYMYIPLIGLSVMIAWLPSPRFVAQADRIIACSILFSVYLIFLVASCRFQVALWNEPERLFLHATEVTDNNSVAFDCLGDTHAERGDHQSAIACFRQSLSIRPREHATRFALSRSLAEQGNLQSALSNCAIAVRQSPDSSRYLILLGQIASRLGDCSLAIRTLQKAVLLEPESPMVHRALGEAYGQCEQLEAALIHFEESLRLSPTDAQVRNSTGFVLRALGRLDEAENQLRISLSLDAASPVTHANLGALLAAKGQRAAAIRHFEEALRIQPVFPQAQRDLDEIRASDR